MSLPGDSEKTGPAQLSRDRLTEQRLGRFHVRVVLRTQLRDPGVQFRDARIETGDVPQHLSRRGEQSVLVQQAKLQFQIALTLPFPIAIAAVGEAAPVGRLRDRGLQFGLLGECGRPLRFEVGDQPQWLLKGERRRAQAADQLGHLGLAGVVVSLRPSGGATEIRMWAPVVTTTMSGADRGTR